MKFQLLQDLIDVIRGKKEIKFVKKNKLLIPFWCRNKAFYITDKGKIFTKKYNVANAVMVYNKNKNVPLSYEKCDSWFLKNIYKERYENQLKFIEGSFFPHIKKGDFLCDIGSASGEFTFIAADYCKHIDGYDLSQKMVDFSINYAKEHNVQNTSFYRIDIQNENIDKQYNHVMFMGVLSYVLEDKKVIEIIEKIRKLLKSKDGYVIYKDNCNYTKDDYYFLGPSINYRMVARSKDKIIKMFKNNGFDIVEEKILHEIHWNYSKCDVTTASLGLILKQK